MHNCIKCGKSINPNATKCRYCFTEQMPDFRGFDIIVTSAPTIEGYEVIEHCGFIYGEIVCPNGVLGALTNGTFFTVSALSDARQKAIDSLKRQAKSSNANAIIGLDIDISDLNGNGVLVSVNGTAVYVIPAEYSNRLDEIKKIQTLRQEDQAREEQEAKLREERINDQLKSVSDIEMNAIDKSILKMILKTENPSAMTILKTVPKSISPSDVSASLNKLVEHGILEKDDNGIFKSKIEIPIE